uniref:Uncharacterized protein n=1 Tax=Arundo donax TaxID=35708 RepID=A0A0A8YVW5_ARUDO
MPVMPVIVKISRKRNAQCKLDLQVCFGELVNFI